MGSSDVQEMFEWAPGAGAFLREPGVVQFGVDATRMGVIETGEPNKAGAMVQGLQGLRAPYTQAEWCSATGLEHSAARSLFEDLLIYGSLRRTHELGHVVIVGSSPLAQRIRELCGDSGIVVRSPMVNENPLRYLAGLHTDYPIVIVDRPGLGAEYARALKAAGATTWLTVTQVDNRGFIGPAHIDGEGPCPLCFDLTRAELDPRWGTLLEQLPAAQPPADPAVTNMIAAHVTLLLRRLVRLSVPPGAPSAQLTAGEFHEIDPYGKNQQRFVAQHHLCPVCFE